MIISPRSGLISRQYYYYDDESLWYRSGRWALAGVLIGLFVLFVLFFLFACFTARRRRKAGRQPMRGTAWTTRVPGLREVPPGTFDPPPGPPPEK